MKRWEIEEIEEKLLDLIIKSLIDNSSSDWIYSRDEVIKFLKHFY